MSEIVVPNLPGQIMAGILAAHAVMFLLRGSVERYYKTKNPVWLWVGAFMLAMVMLAVVTVFGDVQA